MSEKILYAYAIVPAAGQPLEEKVEPVPHGAEPIPIVHGEWAMVVSSVPMSEYSQSSIDEHASDLEWLGPIGVGHQRVNDRLADQGDVMPLRAFTLFSDEASVKRWLDREAASIRQVHDRLEGKLEWTLRLSFEGTAWMKRQDMEGLRRQIDEAPSGKAYLLKKKMERELNQSRDEMENELVTEIARDIERRIGAETIVETRGSRGGADPQIDMLFPRDEADALAEALDEISADLRDKEIDTSLTGPWPPYSFTGSLT